MAAAIPEMVRQHPVRWYTLDFALVAEKLALEVQGCWYHSCQVCFPGSPSHKTQRINWKNDAERRVYLARQGWDVVYVWEHEVRTTRNLRALLLTRLRSSARWPG